MRPYRLDELEKLCGETRLEFRRVGPNRLDVTLAENLVLSFCKVEEEDDTLVGFDGTPWHAHGVVHFLTGGATFVECDELDILVGLSTGDLVVVSRYLKGELADRWLANKREPLDLKDMEPAEELRVFRVGAG